jgi:hypothetical protein
MCGARVALEKLAKNAKSISPYGKIVSQTRFQPVAYGNSQALLQRVLGQGVTR